MMNRTYMSMKRVVFNSHLNNVKFINNKKKMNVLTKHTPVYPMIKRSFQTFHHPQNDPDWVLIFITAFAAFSVSRWIQKR